MRRRSLDGAPPLVGARSRLCWPRLLVGRRSARARSATTAPASTTTEAPTTTTTVPLPPPVPIDWAALRGRLRVRHGSPCPSTTRDPAGPTLEVAVIRRPAGDPADRIGTLVMNPGGPGSSGVRRVQRGLRGEPRGGGALRHRGLRPARRRRQHADHLRQRRVPAFRATDLAPDSPEEQAGARGGGRGGRRRSAPPPRACASPTSARSRSPATSRCCAARSASPRSASSASPTARSSGCCGPRPTRRRSGRWCSTAWWTPDRGDDDLRRTSSTPSTPSSTPSTRRARPTRAARSPTTAACSPPTTRWPHQTSTTEDVPATVSGRRSSPTRRSTATYGSEHWPRLWEALARRARGRPGRRRRRWPRRSRASCAYAPFALVTCLDTPHPVGAEAVAAGRRSRPPGTRRASARSSPTSSCRARSWPRATFVPHAVVAPGTPADPRAGQHRRRGHAVRPGQARGPHLDDGVLLTVDIDGHVALGDSDCADRRRHPLPRRPRPAGAGHPVLGAAAAARVPIIR